MNNMCDAFGIITSSAASRTKVTGLQDHRPMGAFSFAGRYRVIDFPISNMSNSDIEKIQCYIRENPRSIAEHLSNGAAFNINSKRGKLQMIFADNNAANDIYNTDISAYAANLNIISRRTEKYVIIAPSYMVYTQDYRVLLNDHIASGADITLMYHHVTNAKDSFLSCDVVNLNKQKGVLSIERNRGTAKERNIFMSTYVMSKELFVSLIQKAMKLSSIYTLAQIVNLSCEELDIRGFAHRGYFATVNDFNSYYRANLNLLDIDETDDLFKDSWPIYTVTTDSAPTKYTDDAEVKKSLISNGCTIEGTVENSVIGRGVTIKKGAVVKDSIILAYATIGEGVHVEKQVVDKWAQVIHVDELIGTDEKPGYVKRDDIL